MAFFFEEDDLSLSSLSDGHLTLEDFILKLPDTIRKQKKQKESNNDCNDDLIGDLFRRLILDKDEWERFALFDPTRNYTRNLVSTDSETYTLLLLCWNPNCSSPIHDHPCDGCWLRVCEGAVTESRYVPNSQTGELDCVHHECYDDSEALSFIEDSMGYHKMENPSCVAPAVTLHLYSPPFHKCQIWLNPEDASKASKSAVVLYSEYGRKL